MHHSQSLTECRVWSTTAWGWVELVCWSQKMIWAWQLACLLVMYAAAADDDGDEVYSFSQYSEKRVCEKVFFGNITRKWRQLYSM